MSILALDTSRYVIECVRAKDRIVFNAAIPILSARLDPDIMPGIVSQHAVGSPTIAMSFTLTFFCSIALSAGVISMPRMILLDYARLLAQTWSPKPTVSYVSKCV